MSTQKDATADWTMAWLPPSERLQPLPCGGITSPTNQTALYIHPCLSGQGFVGAEEPFHNSETSRNEALSYIYTARTEKSRWRELQNVQDSPQDSPDFR